ncbi:MAG: hypothetical protein L6V95_14205 [Candidatus Melainabacteria bacterium]|nr:MAG: hypothetical protein L6V95_14205 [Candidatus Melainabacteria bacterium]
MNLSLINGNNQRNIECQPLRNGMAVQPLRGKAVQNPSFASANGSNNSVSQKIMLNYKQNMIWLAVLLPHSVWTHKKSTGN